MTTKTFHDFDLDPRLCDALADQGITQPFPIQELTLPVALDGHDVIGQARTGSGKTLGFGLPLLHRVDLDRREVQALVVTPTRELCLQVAEDFQAAAKNLDIQILTVYGGVPIEPQTEALKKGVHVVVGTPGRLLDHVRRGNLQLSTCKTLVLDEADEMLDMGFLPDVEQLIARCADERHTMLFSATMPTAVVNLARTYMDRPTFIRAEVEEHTIPDRMEQHFFLVHKLDKPRVLARILQTPERGLAVVFTRTKAMADRLVDDLRNYDVSAIAIHGDLRQATRERNLDKFKSESAKQDVLVATEVAARGLDIDELTHVINYDPPEDEKMYLHRIGRTARAGEKGVAVTFATFAEVDRLNAIRKSLDVATEPIEEVFSTSDVLTQKFDLPEQTPWSHLGRTPSSSKSTTKDEPAARSKTARKSEAKDERKDERKSEPKRARKDEGDDAAEGIDGSTATRSRTRTRSRDGGGDSGASTPKDASTGTSSSGSSSSGGRRRARPASKRTSGSQTSQPEPKREPKQPAQPAATGSGRQRSSSRKGSSTGSGKQRKPDERKAGRPSGGSQTLLADPASVPTTPGEAARGEGHPGITRQVKVEHLP